MEKDQSPDVFLDFTFGLNMNVSMFKITHPIMKSRHFYRKCVDYTIGYDLCGNMATSMFDPKC